MADETGKELANLYMRGVNEGYNGELMDEKVQHYKTHHSPRSQNCSVRLRA